MGHPTWVYHDTEEAKVVDSDECEELSKSGWRDCPGAVQEEETGFAEDDLDELRAQAMELGVKVDGRWGAERLVAEIKHVQEDPVD